MRTAARPLVSRTLMLTPDHVPPAVPGAPLAEIETAIESGDAGAMLRAWHAACLDALGTQRWEPMIAVGDAARRIGQATGFTIAFAAKARQAYQVALYRAHKQGSREGVMRAADGFRALGDREVVEQCAAIAERLVAGPEPRGA